MTNYERYAIENRGGEDSVRRKVLRGARSEGYEIPRNLQTDRHLCRLARKGQLRKGEGMQYKGKELKSGSECYAAAMDLMRRGGETNSVIFRGTLMFFLKGAEKGDRFCIQRLYEILKTRKYYRWLDSEDCEEIIGFLNMQENIKQEIAQWRKRRSGVFGVFLFKPISRSAAMAFQTKK